jgi:hypothetical protein
LLEEIRNATPVQPQPKLSEPKSKAAPPQTVAPANRQQRPSQVNDAGAQARRFPAQTSGPSAPGRAEPLGGRSAAARPQPGFQKGTAPRSIPRPPTPPRPGSGKKLSADELLERGLISQEEHTRLKRIFAQMDEDRQSETG